MALRTFRTHMIGNPVRRLVATALLALLPVSAVESAIGALRDGAKHHESTAVAAAHQVAGPLTGHGQEDTAPTHEHGRATDHCTHAHGLGLVLEVYLLSLELPIVVQRPGEVAVLSGTAVPDVFHPPRI